MGGGAMLRSAARFVGGAASAPAGAFCHASSASLKSPPEQISLSADFTQKDAHSAFASTSNSVGLLRHDELEDWEYPIQEDWTERSHDRLVFAPAPTEAEVEEATKELQAALHLSFPVGGSMEGNLKSPPSCGSDIGSSFDRPPTHASILSRRLGTLAAGSSSVHQAFMLMQTNPQVQGVVKSLAHDPAVWKAVLNNEKMQEFTQALQDNNEILNIEKSLCPKNESEESNFGRTIASKILAKLTEKILHVMEKIVDIVSTMFGSVEKTSTTDKAIASCVMLAVALVLIVVFRRIPCK